MGGKGEGEGEGERERGREREREREKDNEHSLTQGLAKAGKHGGLPSFPFLSPSFPPPLKKCIYLGKCVHSIVNVCGKWSVDPSPLSLILAPWQNPVTCVGGKGEGEGERGREGERERGRERSKTNERKKVLKATKSLYPHNYVVLREL